MSADTTLAGRLAEHIRAGREPRDNSLLRLSNAGGCSRAIGYLMLGADAEEETLTTLVTFAIGHSYHRMVQAWLSESGIGDPALVEVSLRDDTRRLKGTLDQVTVRLNRTGEPDPNGRRRIIEIKSISNLPREIGGKAYRGAYDCLEKPKDRHIDQATAYCALWNEAHPDDPADMLTFVYVPKDAAPDIAPLKVYSQPFSVKRWDRLQRKFARIWAALDAGEMPERDQDPYSAFSPCRYCSYRGLCLETDLFGDDAPAPEEEEA